MSNAISAHGTIVRRNDVALTEVRSVTPPPLMRQSYDRTRYADDDDLFHMGLRSPGLMTLDISVTDAFQDLIDAWVAADLDTWQIEFPDGGLWEFDGYICGIEFGARVDDLLTANVRVRPATRVLFRDVEGFLLLDEALPPGGSQGHLLQENGSRILL